MEKLLANAILFFHFFYVLFIVGGMILIVFGYALHWKGVRNPIFRWTHLSAMGIVVLETVFGIFCPLTEWEARLRQFAGESFFYPEGFIVYWFHKVLFYNWPPWVFSLLYFILFILIIIGMIILPPRRSEKG